MKKKLLSISRKVLQSCRGGQKSYSTTRPSSNKHANEMRNRLHTSGAVQGSYGPVKIRAQRFLADDPTQSEGVPPEDCKVIHFQRHGQGYHNLLYVVLKDNGIEIKDIYQPDSPFLRPEIVDSPLTEKGRAQCALQRQELACKLNPELLIVSPLHRAIQTAQITFQDFRIPFVAHEACREELGLLTCNQRRPLSETIKEFPDIDFSLLDQTEEDHLWNPTQRECPREKSKRIYHFLVDFVRKQPQREIAIVGHSAWLFNMCNSVVDCGNDEELASWFNTAEIRSMKVTWEDEQ